MDEQKGKSERDGETGCLNVPWGRQRTKLLGHSEVVEYQCSGRDARKCEYWVHVPAYAALCRVPRKGIFLGAT